MKENGTGAKRVKLKVKEKSCPKTAAAAAALYWFIVFSFAVRNAEKRVTNVCVKEKEEKRKTTEKTSFADRFSSLLKKKTSN